MKKRRKKKRNSVFRSPVSSSLNSPSPQVRDQSRRQEQEEDNYDQPNRSGEEEEEYPDDGLE